MIIKFNACSLKIDYLFLALLLFAALFDCKYIFQILLFCVLHEIGHLIPMLAFGAVPYWVELSCYGFVIKHRANLSRFSEFIVLLCGPLVNLICYIFLKNSVNLMLFLLNMLPIFPLDGGRVLALLNERAARVVSAVFLALIFLLSIYLLFAYKIFSLLLVSVYLLIFNIS